MPRSALLLLALCALLPAVAAGQERRCDLLQSGRIDQTTEGVITFLDPFYFRCTDGAELRASQGTLNNLTRELNLVGNVDFKDPLRSLTAQNATYSSVLGRLYATGNVVFVDQTEGITIRGPELEYFRAMEGRPQAQVNASQRPHLTLQPQGEGRDDKPLEIDSDRMTLLGRNDLSAYGSVVIRRPDMTATAGEARFRGDSEGLELRQNARIQSEKYNLRGEVIQARMPGNELEFVESRTRAEITGKDLTLTAPHLLLFFQESELQRTVARGDSIQRAVALSKTFRLIADSLDARLPGQQLDQVVAIGDARGESIDTTRADSATAPPAPRVAAADTAARRATATPATAAGTPPGAPVASLIDRDWIVGDTITGFFAAADSLARVASDTARADTSVVLKRIVARGSAQSLYRVEQEPQSEGGTGKRGINFLYGAVIELEFEDGEMDVARVEGLKRGLFLDPAPPPPATAAPPPDGSTTPRTTPNGREGNG